ncbi:MAG: hypothetical protein MJK13_00270 [Pseudomonadales bacterium]|nr:hypothetical protein [Pseudomonadales bacterium]
MIKLAVGAWEIPEMSTANSLVVLDFETTGISSIWPVGPWGSPGCGWKTVG